MGIGATIRTKELNLEDFLLLLSCPICTEILAGPVRTPCNHLFCQDCLLTALAHKKECPLDHVHIQEDQVQPDLVIQRIIGSLPCSCSHETKGCPWRGTISEIASHSRICPFEVIGCPFQGCHAKAIRRDLEDHLKECEWKKKNWDQDGDADEPQPFEGPFQANPSSSLTQRHPHHTPVSQDETSLHTDPPSSAPQLSSSSSHNSSPLAPRRRVPQEHRDEPSLGLQGALGFLFSLFFVPSKARPLALNPTSSLMTFFWVASSLLTTLPLFLLFLGLAFDLLPKQQGGLPGLVCIFLGLYLLFAPVLKRITVVMPFLFGATIVDDVPTKFLVASLFSGVTVAATSGGLDPLDLSIVAASTVGIFVIYYIRVKAMAQVFSPLKLSVLDLLSAISSVVILGLRSTLVFDPKLDLILFLYGLFISFLLGIFSELTHNHNRRSQVAIYENDMEFLNYLFQEWILSVVCPLFLFEGNGIKGNKVIYVVAAANHWKLLLYFCDLAEPLRVPLRALLAFITFACWSFISITFFKIFDAKIFAWDEETFFPFHTLIISTGALLATYSAMYAGRFWAKSVICTE